MSTTPDPASPQPGDAAEPTLIDRYLPRFDVTQIEHRVVDADTATTWTALTELDLLRVHTPLLDAAFAARQLPAKVGGWLGRSRPAPPPPPELKPAGGDVGLPGWLSLGRVEGHEIALGAIGRFWQPTIEWYDVSGMTPDEFAAFDEPGWGRIAASISLRPYGRDRTLVSYEARTATSDPDAARKFSRYWRLARPFVAHIMRATLATLARDAEQRSAG